MSVTLNDPVKGAVRIGCDECGAATFTAGGHWPAGWRSLFPDLGPAFEACPDCEVNELDEGAGR